MLTKCNCNNCSAQLEFESSSVGSIVTCPQCRLETRLFIPPTPEVPTFEKATPELSTPMLNPMLTASSPAATLDSVRGGTCYGTLRGLVGVVQLLVFVLAGVVALSGVFGIVAGFRLHEAGLGLSVGIPAFCGAVLLSVLGVAGKQAALLLVDIADCQIQQAARRS